MTAYGLDSHKLCYHPGRVADFLAGRMPAPIYMEVSITNRCNQNCCFCGLDYRRREPHELSWPVLSRLLDAYARMGGRSVCFAGEGEPLLYPRLPEALVRCRQLGLDAAVVTNGALLTRELAEVFVCTLKWIKISVNAATPATYARLHGVPGPVLDGVFANIAELTALARRRRSRMTVGSQAILLPENAGELPALARRVRAAGADYFVLKPYNRNPRSRHRACVTGKFPGSEKIARRLRAESRPGFAVVVRERALHHAIAPRPYHGCLGIAFAAFVSADAQLYTCPPHMGMAEFSLGKITRTGLRAVWQGRRRRLVCQRLARRLARCMPGCRLDEINRYLWSLTHPGPHVNFI